MKTVQHCQTIWKTELRGAATLTHAECTNHRVIDDGSITHHFMTIQVRDEDFARRRHNGNITGVRQRAGGPRQLSHPSAIRGPQHCHTTVATIHREEEGLVGGQHQAKRLVELAGSIAPRSNGAMPLAFQLKQLEEK